MFRKDLTKISVKISLTYLVVAGAWVFFSDELLVAFVHDEATELYLSIAKGWLFALATAAMLYLLTNRVVGEICQSRDFYLKIFEDFPALVWRAGTDAGCDYFNQTWLAFTGRTLDEERGEGWTAGVHPEDLDQCLKTYRNAFSSRQPFSREYRLRRHDGEYCWIIDHGKPLYDHHDKFIGYIGTCYDVTEHKRAVEALSQSEKRFRELSENTSDWVWEVDDTMRYVYASPKVTELLGYAPADVLGKSPFDFMIPGDAARLRPGFEDFVKSPRPFKGLENVNVHRDGSLVVLETSGVPLYDAEGRFSGFRGIDRDISARREAEERVRSLNAALAHQAGVLEAANRELEAFSHTVAHDLRAPLTNISLSCQVIMELCGTAIGDQCRKTLQGICGAVDRMDSLITGLLNLSRVSRSAMTLETVNLSELARMIASDLQLGQGDRRVEVTISDGITARGDASLLNVVLANLLGNAWKYTRKTEAAVIEFGTTELEGERAFYVRDNGAGFDMEQVDKLFGPFERLHSAKEFEGHGIGLATVQRIVQRHGGRVWAEGAVGQGATFYFTLAPKQDPAVSAQT
ncbi:MAG TPA: PAS domain S-box protein [Geobacteraceae bacterium]